MVIKLTLKDRSEKKTEKTVLRYNREKLFLKWNRIEYLLHFYIYVKFFASIEVLAFNFP